MYRKCATEISVQNQRKIELALLALMEKVPFEEISVTELCASAQVARRIFYHLFGNKTDALHALIDHTILRTESFRPELSDDALRFFLYWKEQKPLLDALRRNELLGLLQERLLLIVLSEDYEVRYWIKHNGWDREQDVLIFHLCGIMGLICSWYYSGYDRTAEEMADLLKQLILLPLVRSTL